MKLFVKRIRLPLQFGLAVSLLFAAGGSWAAQRGGTGTAEAQYRQERQKCMSGQSNQERATCLKEASAALAEARRNRLADGGGTADYRRNALARCDAQPESEREACRALARGEGTSSGTAEQGGVIRERRTQVPAPR